MVTPVEKRHHWAGASTEAHEMAGRLAGDTVYLGELPRYFLHLLSSGGRGDLTQVFSNAEQDPLLAQ